MNFRQFLIQLKFWNRGEVGSKDMPYSIVLLTREFHKFTKTELQSAGERGWRRKFDGLEDPMWFVFLSDVLTTLKAGKYLVQLIQVGTTYSDLDFGAKNLPQEEQRKAWFEHRAWVALDLWNGNEPSGQKLSKKEAYAVLARFALPLGDENCSAIYFPKEGWMMPNNGAAEEGLRRLIEAFPL
jgi:hypothetical protein